jgi:hypothetical protein
MTSPMHVFPWSPALRVLGLSMALAVAALGGACGPQTAIQENPAMSSFREVPDSAWAQLGRKRIWFGHQSVGGNIMQGVAELAGREAKLGLRILDGSPADSAGVFAHGLVGRNGEPGVKTDDFARALEGGAGARLDIAFHKYCYADIVDTTDVERIFAHYRDTMARLKGEFPNVVFVHVTSPLVSVQGGPRAALKKFLGQAPGRYESNFRRERFNQLMRAEYGGREPLFDLAAVESTRPDGTREAISLGGRTAFALHSGYTADGSHLNERGRRKAAEELLAVLARLAPGS